MTIADNTDSSLITSHSFIATDLHRVKLKPKEIQWLQKHPTITFTGDPDWLPYEAFDENGIYIGIVADHLDLIKKHSGINLHIVPTKTWQESIAGVRSGDIHVISETVDSALSEHIVFTKPYLTSPITITMRSEHDYVDNIQQISDKKIGLIRDQGYVKKIIETYPDLEYYWFNNIQQALAAVSSGRVDATLTTLANSSYAMTKFPGSNLRVVGKTEFTNDLAFGVRKEYASVLIPILNRALNAITVQEKQVMFDKWGKVEFKTEVEPDYHAIVEIILGFLILLGIVLYRNYALQQQMQTRKQAEKALKESEQRFHSIFDDAPLGIAIIDSKLDIILDVNPLFSVIIGRDKAALINTDWINIVHPDDKIMLREHLHKMHNDKLNLFNTDMRCVTPDENIIWLNLTVSPLTTIVQNEEQASYLCMIEDITSSKAKDDVLTLLAESKKTEENILDVIVRQITLSTGMAWSFISIKNTQDVAKMDVLAANFHGNKMDNISYLSKDTPCESVMINNTAYCPDNVQDLFLKMPALKDVNAVSYFGVSLLNNQHQVVGILGIIDDKPMDLHPDTMALFHSLAVRASIEIERQQIDSELKKLSLAVKYSPSAVMITDHKAIIEYVNPRFSEITGFSMDELIGKTPALFNPSNSVHDKSKDIWETLLTTQEWQEEIECQKKNGDTYWARQFITPILNNSGEISHFVSIHDDITKSKRINEEIHHRASHDMLTGLINRSEFEHRLGRVVKTAQKDFTIHALCFLDLDKFKVVNDTSGHIAGDELLRQLGSVLRSHIRQRDTLARIGGDEFAILMEHCGSKQASRAAEAVRKLIEDFQFDWEDRSYRIGVSIGVALINNSTTNAVEALKYADLACYTAKDHGRNRIHIYEHDDENQAKQESDTHWATRTSEALDNDHFLLYVQPIKPILDPDSTTAYEILLRLKDPSNNKIIPPGAFLPAAERYNLACKVDLWVIDHLFNWVAKNSSKLDEIHHFSINLSGQSLGDETLLGHVVTLLNNKIFPAEKITFEITETAAITNLRDATNFMTVLKNHGCKFALDDFGSGLSSFAYLKNLPVDYLKIDGMFVRDILADPIDAAMVRSINDIGHVMNLKTIAEFVESDEIEHQLVEIGVDYVQGCGISKPFPLDDLLK